MLQKFESYINSCNLLAEGDKVILALSGGIDSMVLADLLLKAKVEFVAAHCNFHLRGNESDGDDWFVRKFAEKRGIQCFVKHFETEKYAANHGISIEMAARDLRYSWFEQLRQQLGYDKIAVAHHADDQAETFFINLLRGAGLNGLKGMKPQNGVIIRPLLWASREQIRKYAVENHIVWREDHTNVESVYLRNRIRNQLLPVFDELQPKARQGLYKSLEHLSAENELYRELLKEKLAQIVERDGEIQRLPYSVLSPSAGGPSTGSGTLDFTFQLLFEWLRQYGFNTDQCHFIYDAIGTGIGNQYCSPTNPDSNRGRRNSLAHSSSFLQIGENCRFHHQQIIRCGSIGFRQIKVSIDTAPLASRRPFPPFGHERFKIVERFLCGSEVFGISETKCLAFGFC